MGTSVKNVLAHLIVFISRVIDFFEWLVTDHNGKPSTSRLLLWVWTVFCIIWVTHEVNETHTITLNAVYLVTICLFGPAISLVMKGASFKDFVEIIGKVTATKVESTTKRVRELLKPSTEEEDGA